MSGALIVLLSLDPSSRRRLFGVSVESVVDDRLASSRWRVDIQRSGKYAISENYLNSNDVVFFAMKNGRHFSLLSVKYLVCEGIVAPRRE